jgi:hypothetical protein
MILAILVAALAGPASAKPCVVLREPSTIRQEFAVAAVVAYGHLEDPHRGPGEGNTAFVIQHLFKGHRILGADRVLRIPRYVPVDQPGTPAQFLVFADLHNGQLDFYRGEPLTPSGLRYVRKLLAVAPEDRVGVLRFCVDYLIDAEPAVATDALREFALATDMEWAAVAKRMPVDKLRHWLRHHKTDGYKVGTVALLLGHIGDERDLPLLRDLANLNPGKGGNVYIHDKLATALVLARPPEGWAHLSQFLNDPNLEFHLRFAVLRTLRYFHDERPGVLSEGHIRRGMGRLLEHSDLADFVIDDLWRWQEWGFADAVLGLYGKEKYNLPIVRRAIVRYALMCPGGRAERFVEKIRAVDPEFVSDTEEMLQLDGRKLPR